MFKHSVVAIAALVLVCAPFFSADPKDRDPMIDYLSANFPPDKPADPPTKVARGK